MSFMRSLKDELTPVTMDQWKTLRLSQPVKQAIVAHGLYTLYILYTESISKERYYGMLNEKYGERAVMAAMLGND
jgi:hypothetical protein